MNPQFKLEPWPFPMTEPVELVWLRHAISQLTEDELCVAVFRESNGLLRPVTLPWAMLPVLRIGTFWVGGSPSVTPESGRVIEMLVPPETHFRCEPARHVLRKDEYPLADPQSGLESTLNLDQPCQCAEVVGRKIVVATLETIRALLAPTCQFALGLLEGDFLRRIVVEEVVREDTLWLTLNDQIPAATLCNPVVAHLARLLKDHSFHAAWQTASRSLRDARKFGALGLHASMPTLQPHWRVRAIERGRTVVILEILEVLPALRHGWKNIKVMHPGVADDSRQSPWRSEPASRPPGTGIPLAASPIAGSFKHPRFFADGRFGIREAVRMGVERVFSGRREGKSDGQESDSGSPSPGAKPATHSFGLSGGAGSGTSKIGEFGASPEARFSYEDGDGLKLLACALTGLGCDASDWQVSDWRTGEIGGETSFAKIGGERKRRYAAVKLAKNSSTVLLLEIGCPDRHEISTLLFLPCEGTAESICNELTAIVVQSQGQWNVERLNRAASAHQFQYGLVKHSSCPESWTARLLSAATGLITPRTSGPLPADSAAATFLDDRKREGIT